MRRIVILGGGMTGLALAYLRNQNPAPGDDILVLEEGPQAGGSIRTLHEEGLVLEAGPHTLRTTAAAERLISGLDLTNEVLVADPRAPRWIVRGGRARKVIPGPAGLLTTAIPFGARFRALGEPFVAPRPAGLADESVHDFFSRRFGAGLARYAAEPLVSGVRADDPKTLSTRSAFPELWEAEVRVGSVLRGLLQAPHPPGPRFRPRTVSFRNGLASLTERLVARSQRAGVRVELNAEILAIEGPFDGDDDGIWKVQIADGTIYPADTLVSTLDATAFASLLETRLPRSASRVSALAYSRLAVVLQAFRPGAPEGRPARIRRPGPARRGVPVPRCPLSLLALPRSSPRGSRPDDLVLRRRARPVAPDLTEGDLLKLAEAEVRRLHPAIGPRVHGRVLKWPAALPRLPVGHHATLDLLAQDLAEINAGHERPRLVVTGSWRDGVGLGERIARAEELAPIL
ncbi:MAG: protoporphyrinogen oxidase [Holophagales bacterium]|nr:protoporphyrinogen oxidase [Holophagales bacterium]